jgi:hypothetical protein
MATLSLENRVLTLTNDDGTTSSVDLSEVKGDIGVRGPQGIAGPAVNLNDYYTKQEVEQQISEALPPVDLSNYYTKQEVEQQISDALPPSAEEVDY